MERSIYRVILNLGLLISGIATVFSGLLIQVNYHMGNHGNIEVNDCVIGISYNGWSTIHKIAIVVFTLLITYHIYHHRQWYRVVVKKKLFARNKQVIILSVLFVLVAITGFTPWFIDLLNVDEMLRKVIIEIHDKLAIIIAVYLTLHIIKRLRWFYQL